MKFVVAVVALLVASASADTLSRQKRQLMNTCTASGTQCSLRCPSGYSEDTSKSCGFGSLEKCCAPDPTKSPNQTNKPIVTPTGCGENMYGRFRKMGGLVQPYVVGGNNTDEHEYPWQVSLKKTSHTCGGSIINNRYIVTAAHCVSSTDPSPWTVVAGEHDLKTNSGREASYKLEKIIKHSGYSSTKSNLNDIALMKTTTEIEFNDYVQPICLPNSDYPDLEAQLLTATGWGATSEGGSLASVLQEVDVPCISNTNCASAYPRESIYSTSICAGDLANGGIDTCQGDSGGPLTHTYENGREYLVGITSWGYGCAQKGKPGVYTRASEYYDWIMANAV